ncbi:hypothetical protein TWF481_001984 [Arthrobotrys musiformis]|uniref:F-box domain-containing protein n=1 Tax=Arthrobotrys musiformis TaxID=47236 RepID=A0AAV9W0Y5_9PEZI
MSFRPFHDIVGLAPFDIKLEILSYIKDARSIIQWTRVSKTWRDFLTSPDFSSFYKGLLSGVSPRSINYLKCRAKYGLSTSEETDSPPYREALIKLISNQAQIQAGKLHEAGSLVTPVLGRIKFCYSGGFLAICGADESSNAERNVIYVYNLSILDKPGSEISGRRFECEGVVEHIAIANMRLAYLARDPENEAQMHVGLLGLIKPLKRSCVTTAPNIDMEQFASILVEDGKDAFTHEDKGRSSSLLRLPNSPEFFCTSGRFVVFSASFMTHCTIWDFGSHALGSENPITGKSFTLDPEWIDFVFPWWEVSPDPEDEISRLSYFMSIDDAACIYTTINGNIPDGGCECSNDHVFYSYACRYDGTPIPMYHQGWTLPRVFPDCRDHGGNIYVADDLTSFQSAGQNFLAVSPPTFLSEYSHTTAEYTDDSEGGYGGAVETGDDLDLYYPRIMINRKRRTRDSPPQEKPQYHYTFRYLDRRRFWLAPPEGLYGYEVLGPRVIPIISKDSVIWECRHKRDVVRQNGGQTIAVKRVKIFGLKPTIIPERENLEEEPPGVEAEGEISQVGVEDAEPEFWRPVDRGSLDPLIPEPTSVCELTMDYDSNHRLEWVGDHQQIILLERRPKEPGNQEPESILEYENVFRVFRYGASPQEPIDYTVQYREDCA